MRHNYDYLEDRPATEAEAHAEWHRNTGTQIWKDSCPWDSCGHPSDDYYEEETKVEHSTRLRLMDEGFGAAKRWFWTWECVCGGTSAGVFDDRVAAQADADEHERGS